MTFEEQLKQHFSNMGKKGAKSRMSKSTPEQRQLWASMGGKARKKKLDEKGGRPRK